MAQQPGKQHPAHTRGPDAGRDNQPDPKEGDHTRLPGQCGTLVGRRPGCESRPLLIGQEREAHQSACFELDKAPAANHEQPVFPSGRPGHRLPAQEQQLGVLVGILGVAVMIEMEGPVHGRCHAKGKAAEPGTQGVQPDGLKGGLVRTLVKGGEQRSPYSTKPDREQARRQVRMRRHEQHAIRTQQESGQMEGQPDNGRPVLALLKGAQEGAVDERAVFKGFVHTATLQPACGNVKEKRFTPDSRRSGSAPVRSHRRHRPRPDTNAPRRCLRVSPSGAWECDG